MDPLNPLQNIVISLPTPDQSRLVDAIKLSDNDHLQFIQKQYQPMHEKYTQSAKQILRLSEQIKRLSEQNKSLYDEKQEWLKLKQKMTNQISDRIGLQISKLSMSGEKNKTTLNLCLENEILKKQQLQGRQRQLSQQLQVSEHGQVNNQLQKKESSAQHKLIFTSADKNQTSKEISLQQLLSICSKSSIHSQKIQDEMNKLKKLNQQLTKKYKEEQEKNKRYQILFDQMQKQKQMPSSQISSNSLSIFDIQKINQSNDIYKAKYRKYKAKYLQVEQKNKQFKARQKFWAQILRNPKLR